MNTGTKIAIGAGAFLLLSRRQAAAQTAAAQASSPVAAASAGLASLEKSLFSLLSNATKPSAAPKSSGGGMNPAGGAGSGRSAGGSTPVSSVEDVFGTFDNLNSPNVIPTTSQDGTVLPPDLSVAGDPSADNSLINSLVDSSSGVPQFDGMVDPNTGLAFIPDTSGNFSGVQDATDFSDPTAGGF